MIFTISRLIRTTGRIEISDLDASWNLEIPFVETSWDFLDDWDFMLKKKWEWCVLHDCQLIIFSSKENSVKK